MSPEESETKTEEIKEYNTIEPTAEVTVTDVSSDGAGEEVVIPVPTRKEQLQHLVTIEVKRIVAKSKYLQARIQESKTSTKKKFYLKKLRKNNKELADMLIRLENLNRGVADV